MARYRSSGECGRPGELDSPCGCRVQCDAARCATLTLPWAHCRTSRGHCSSCGRLGSLRLPMAADEAAGGIRHSDSLARRVRLRRMPPGAERRRQGTLPAEGAGATASRSKAAAPGCDLRPQTIPPGAPHLGLTCNQVWGLTKTDDGWAAALEAALTATPRDDLQHTNAANVAGCVCKECREHQRVRMAKNRG
jgi:hypothetical protein